ncbi:hypothetical protein D3C87_1927570 [compost metagenome]
MPSAPEASMKRLPSSIGKNSRPIAATGQARPHRVPAAMPSSSAASGRNSQTLPVQKICSSGYWRGSKR